MQNPAYEVNSKRNPVRARINRTELLKYQVPFWQNLSHQVIFLTKGNSLTILSEDKDYNNKVVKTLTIIGQGR
jgi:hypothetical protein